jgi:nucleoside-diphosphate-sugar epimerase
MGATILPTGASGYIGSRLLRVLEEGGCAVRCFARQPSAAPRGRANSLTIRDR